MAEGKSDVLKGAGIILGVSGSIAAYKAADLASRLTQRGAEVHAVMTRAATELVGPMTFHALTRLPVHTELFPAGGSSRPYHIDLVDQADLMIIAPATANVIGKVAAGIGDDILTTTALAAFDMPVLIAPAMNVRMFENPIVQGNIERLKELGFVFVEPGEGYLACGYEGKGRMAEPEELVAAIENELTRAASRDRQFPRRG